MAKNQIGNIQEADGMSDLSDNRSAGTGYFIIGARGQLGKALQAKYPGAKSAGIDELDITNQKSVESFDWTGIKEIVNESFTTGVSRCDKKFISINSSIRIY